MATIDRRGNALLTTGFFPPVRAATTAAVTLAGLQTLDGVALLDGDRVLVKNQADQTTNGLYVASTGPWLRSPDAAGNTQLFDGMCVVVAQGLAYGGFAFRCTNTDDPVVIGTSLLTWTPLLLPTNPGPSGSVNWKTFGATGNAVELDYPSSVFISAGSPNLNVTGALFTAADVGKTILVAAAGAAGANLLTTIKAVTDATHLVLNANAGTAVAGAFGPVIYGTDDTAALQLAITSAALTGSEAFGPAGGYLITSPLLVTGQMALRGVMRGSYLYPSQIPTANRGTVIFVTGQVSDGIDINTDSPVTVERLMMRASPGVTGGAMIRSNANLSLNIGVTIRDVFMWEPYVGIDFENSVSFTVDNCFIQSNTGAAIICRDTDAPGSGDCTIINSTISQNTSGTGINVLTTGGMRIINNKISSGVYAVLVQIGPASTASPFVCNDNSFEGSSSGNIVIGSFSGTPTFGGGSISGNEMYGPQSCIVVSGTSVGLLSQIAITGNYFQNNAAAGLVTLQNATRFIFSGNVLAGAASSTGVSCGASAEGVIGPNEYVPVSGGIPISNASAAVAVTQVIQRGSVAVTCSTGRGGEFIGAVTVTFPLAFRATPTVMASARDSTGIGLGAFTLSAGLSTVQIGGVSSSNGGVVTVDWVAFADS